MLNYQFIDSLNTRYLVKRSIRESHLVPDYDIKILKKWAHCDSAFRKDGILYLCEKVPDAEIISEEKFGSEE